MTILLPHHEPNFQLLFIFNHLFITFLKVTKESSLSTYSNFLSKVFLNFFNDDGLWHLHFMTLTSMIQTQKQILNFVTCFMIMD
jgi:hypothetical protein